MYVLIYDYVEDIAERRAPFREQHLAHIRQWNEQRGLTMGGALGDRPTGGLFVFDVDDPATVDEFAAADPYVANGLVTRRRVESWNVVT